MYKFIIKGVVQGVGFRPYIYNACQKAGLKGYVQNTGAGVVVEINHKKKFLEILKKIPPLARIDSIKMKSSKNSFNHFFIKKSSGKGFSEIPPDLYLCSDCLKELNDPTNQRHHYFFITCTNCGPRFSITQKTPYDRDTTTMKDFLMCKKCKEEYTHPSNRRYHAQTIACPQCGPKLFLIHQNQLIQQNTIKRAVNLIKKNMVLALKGIGGFHLVCNTQPAVIKKLKKMTARRDKPFALMCRDLKMVNQIACFNAQEQKMLLSIQRPIVVLKKKKKNSFKQVSELDTLGIMLPYTGLHFLLFNYLAEPLIMTSSNPAGEPITILKDQQKTKAILFHNRKIENPIDDSVIKVIKNQTLFLRRGRGFVPQSIALPIKNNQPILALGAEQNSCFSLYKEKRAILSQYLGDTSNLKAFNRFQKTLKKFLVFTKIKPEIILADKHPLYRTSLYSQELAQKLQASLHKIQHHQAHAYSVAGEYNLKDFTAIVCDGSGLGNDGKLWGGEVFFNDKRIGHLEPQYQLGGDSAVQHPAKMLFSILRKFLSFEDAKKYIREYFNQETLNILDQQLIKKFNCPLTTSCGRILDAAAFLLGFCNRRTYPGRPAMLLEANSTKAYNFQPIVKKNILLTTPLFQFLIKNLNQNKKRLAATVQLYLIQGLYKIAVQYKKPLIFSGGCAYNRIMTGYILKQGGYVNNKVPAGDGGISFGQIVYYLRKKP